MRSIFILHILLILLFLVPIAEAQSPSLSRSTIVDKADSLELTDKTLTDTFPQLQNSFQKTRINFQSDSSLLDKPIGEPTSTIETGEKGSTSSKLSSGVKVMTEYSFKSAYDTTSQGKVKQLIKVENPQNIDIKTDVRIFTTINSNSYIWDGKEYTIGSNQPIRKAYKSKREISADSESAIPANLRKNLPHFSTDILKGYSISFKSTDGKIATYDFADVANMNHEVRVYKLNGESVIELLLKDITVKAKSTKVIDPQYSLSNSTTFNVRIDGAAAGQHLSYSGISAGDINNDGLPEVIIRSGDADLLGRTDSGAIYVISGTQMRNYTTKGTTVDLANSANYSFVIVGATANSFIGRASIDAVDMNNDGKNDLVFTSWFSSFNSRANSGSMYILDNAILANIQGTGNTLDLATASNYTLRIDGAVANDNLGHEGAVPIDFDKDGWLDLFIMAGQADKNSRTDSGSVYYINDSIFRSKLTGTGNTLDLATTTNYSIRLDGAAAGDFFGYGALAVGDLNNDGRNDLIVGACCTTHTGGSNDGSLYIYYNSIFTSHPSAGTNLDMASTTNFTARYDGSAQGNLTYSDGILSSPQIADMNQDGLNDIIVGEPYGWEGGDVYILANKLVARYTGTGNVYQIADTSKYSLRITYYDNANYPAFGEYGTLAQDMNNDGRKDLVIGAPFNPSDTGELYVLYNSRFGSLEGFGKVIRVTPTSGYDLLFTGVVGDEVGWSLTNTIDLNGDGSLDFMIGTSEADNNSRSDSGSLYITYNFPHSVTATTTSSSGKEAFVISGTATAQSYSTTTITGVQYKLDSNDPRDNWASCSPTDGSFNGLTESYTCSVSNLTQGSHSVYVRAIDTNGSYTAASRYPTFSYKTDTVAPLSKWRTGAGLEISYGLDDPDNVITSEHWPWVTFTKSSDPTSGVLKYQLILYTHDKGEYIYVDDIYPDSPAEDSLSRETNDLSIKYDNEQYKIVVRGKSDKYKLENGAYKYKIRAIDKQGNVNDTPWHILLINTLSSNFNGPWFPLSLQTIGSRSGLNISSLNPSSIPKSVTIFNRKPTIYGIANGDALVRVSLEYQYKDGPRGGPLVYETVANSQSRFGINISETLAYGTYKVWVEAISQYGDYAKVPAFFLYVSSPDKISTESISNIQTTVPTASPQKPSNKQSALPHKSILKEISETIGHLFSWSDSSRST